MARRVMMLATGLAVANAFMAPAHSGLALRSNRVSSSTNAVRRSVRNGVAAPKMQLEHLAEHATLLAAYPEGFVNGMTAYFNLCKFVWSQQCVKCLNHCDIHQDTRCGA